MGITVEKYFENLYSVIFSPKAFFKREDLSISIRLAITTITLVTVFTKCTIATFEGTIGTGGFYAGIIGGILSTIFLWFITGLFFEYTAKIYGKDGNLTKILFFTSFAPVPYIFYAPLNLLKNVGSIGYVLGTYSEIFLYFWIIFLYALAINATYKISIARSFMLIFLPFVATFFAFYWIICFFSKLWYILSI